MERLRGGDAAFLSLETPTNHMHVAVLAVVDPSGAPGGWSFDALCDMVGTRLHLAPAFRRRIVEVPLGLHHPCWVDDPAFDLDDHLVRHRAEEPGGRGELLAVVARILSTPLVRSRPLWELHVVEGLADGRVGIVAKTHHAVNDGVAGAAFFLTILDFQPEPAPVAPEAKPWRPGPLPSDGDLLADAVVALAGQPPLMVNAAQRAIQTMAGVRQRRSSDGAPDLSAPFAAPRTSLNRPVGAERDVHLVDVAFDEVRAIKSALGVTVNDVVLTLVGSALRDWMRQGGEVVDGDLVALVPISIRAGDEESTAPGAGNRVAPMLVSLATTVADPLERLAAVARSARAAKAQEKEVGSGVLADIAEVTAPALVAAAARLASSLRLADHVPPSFNLSVSNVPGPPVPVYLAGGRVEAVYPLGPVVDGSALNITVLSYNGRLAFGLVADRDARVDLARLGAGLVAALAELGTAVDGRSGGGHC